MPAGNTVTDSIADSLNTVVAAARIVREQKGVVPQSVERQTLKPNSGLSWREISFDKLTSQNVDESTELDNPQQLVDTAFTVTPTVSGIQTLITDRVGRRMDKAALARTGKLAQNAQQRKKDEDGIVAIDGMTALGSSATLVSGIIRAARYVITSNTTEPAPEGDQISTILHGFVIKDIEDEVLVPTSGAIVASSLGSDLATSTFQNGYQGQIGGTMLREDGNIPISGNNAKGGTFAKSALVLVQGHSPKAEVRREPHIAGGATSMFHYDEYAYGERSAGNWGREILADATAPTT